MMVRRADCWVRACLLEHGRRVFSVQGMAYGYSPVFPSVYAPRRVPCASLSTVSSPWSSNFIVCCLISSGRHSVNNKPQAAKRVSVAESERAALSLEVSTAEARAREIMVILDEREEEAAALRQGLAAKEERRQEKRLFLDLRTPALSSVVEATAPPPLTPPPREEASAFSGGKTAVAATAAAAADFSTGRCDVQVSTRRRPGCAFCRAPFLPACGAEWREFQRLAWNETATKERGLGR